MEIGTQIKALRLRKGVTQKAIAQAILWHFGRGEKPADFNA